MKQWLIPRLLTFATIITVAACQHHVKADPLTQDETFAYVKTGPNRYSVVAYTPNGLSRAEQALKCKPCAEQRIGVVWHIERLNRSKE